MNSIIWRRWQDPLYPLVEAYEPEEDEEDYDFKKAIESFGGDKENKYKQKYDAWGGPIMMGPHGIVPLMESNLPGTLYNFWVGDTNFDLTKNLRSTIARVPGVESLDVFTRYRFRLGVGRAFDQAKVKASVETSVQPKVKPVATANLEKLDAVKKMLQKKFPFWAIVSFPNGKYEYVGGRSEDEVYIKLKRFDNIKQEIVLSWEKECL
jgi:hypothetical protein